MDQDLEKAFQTMLDNWERMKQSDEEEAEADADQFQASFYALMEQVRSWFGQLPEKPESLDEALQMEEISRLVERLPGELLLNLETEFFILRQYRSL